MQRNTELRRTTSSDILPHVKLKQRAKILGELNGKSASRALEKSHQPQPERRPEKPKLSREEEAKFTEDVQSLRMMERQGKSDKAKETIINFKSPAYIAEIISKLGVSDLTKSALHELPSKKLAQVLTELENRNSELPSRFLTNLNSNKAAEVVERLEGDVASRLMERVGLKKRVGILDNLKPTKAAELLAGLPSAKMVETLVGAGKRKGIREWKETFKTLETKDKVTVITQAEQHLPHLVSTALQTRGHSRETAQIVSQLLKKETTHLHAVRVVEGLTQRDARAAARVVKNLTTSDASYLMGQVKAEIGGKIVTHGRVRTSTRMLSGMESPEKAKTIVIHTNKERVAGRLTKQLAEVRTQHEARETRAMTIAKNLKERLESRDEGAVREVTNRLKPKELIQALEKMEPAGAVRVLYTLPVQQERAVLQKMEPASLARLVPAYDRKNNELTAAHRLPLHLSGQQLGRVFEELMKHDRGVADKTFSKMPRDSRVETLKAMTPKAAADMWERMEPKATAKMAEMLPHRTLDQMIQSMDHRVAAAKIEQLPAADAARLLVSIDKDPENQSRLQKATAATVRVLIPTTAATAIGQLTIIELNNLWADPLVPIVFNSFAGSMFANFIGNNVAFRMRNVVKFPDKKLVPHNLRGQPVGKFAGMFEVYSSVAWTSAALAQITINKYVFHIG